jgi:hypothetical protein
MEAKDILINLLHLELVVNANRLKFIDINYDELIDEEFLTEAISALNDLSIKTDELSKKQLIAICALLWTYSSGNTFCLCYDRASQQILRKRVQNIYRFSYNCWRTFY